ncbi:hypothetical protein FCV17_02300 [Mycobacterium avium subsp. hominissuis]|uniref:hypothetical protein n=1 Tax=Mycobacterium avium TaxID=1764 RepID=UPI0010CCBE54|nr:hypothetical protein [Mycobacterium avium]QCR70767.1 hypothetical protein FCV17_02300 [Mycobacterium avium subsp. hominissuis]QCR78201.1 hypothetical protein FCV16_19040 [Mycobacterium avium subsp. hominissuis]QCR81532.1 hypothetical protein FCV18_10540 [Mycobacterium avium subsp. hominissuis]
MASKMHEFATGKRTLNIAHVPAIDIRLAAGVGVGARAGMGGGRQFRAGLASGRPATVAYNQEEHGDAAQPK